MSVVIILIAASLTVAVGFLLAFIWSVKTGQYDDDYTPSVRMLFDDLPPQAGQAHGTVQDAAPPLIGRPASLSSLVTPSKPIKPETTNPKQ